MNLKILSSCFLVVFIVLSGFSKNENNCLSNRLSVGVDIARPFKYLILKNKINPELITRYKIGQKLFIQNVFGASFFNHEINAEQFLKQNAYYTKLGLHYFKNNFLYGENTTFKSTSVGFNLGYCSMKNEGSIQVFGPLLTPFNHQFSQNNNLLFCELEFNHSLFSIRQFVLNANVKIGGLLNSNQSVYQKDFKPLPFAGFTIDKQTFGSFLGFNLMYHFK